MKTNRTKSKKDKRAGKGLHRIYCVDCGKPRWVNAANAKQVKRCKECVYNFRRRYNSKYVKQRRETGKPICVVCGKPDVPWQKVCHECVERIVGRRERKERDRKTCK